MFARLRETIGILAYRSPVVHGPDVVIIEKGQDTSITKPGRIIAVGIEAFGLLYLIGYTSARLSTLLDSLHVTKVGLPTLGIAGALGVALYWLVEAFFARFQAALKTRLNLSDRLAPYFGHKLDDTFRAIRG